jgi:hypothetical protein
MTALYNKGFSSVRIGFTWKTGEAHGRHRVRVSAPFRQRAARREFVDFVLRIIGGEIPLLLGEKGRHRQRLTATASISTACTGRVSAAVRPFADRLNELYRNVSVRC